MNRLKKVFIVVATSLAMLSTSAILPVSASTINYGDTNNDGVVDLLDAVYLNKYLAGKCLILAEIICLIFHFIEKCICGCAICNTSKHHQ